MPPPRASFNASWFIDGNLALSIQKFISAGLSAGRRKLGGHADNAPPNISRMTQNIFGHNSLKRLRHPPYSPNICPSDFSLFGKVKSALVGQEAPDEIHLLEAVTEILNGISDAEWQCVFRSWIEGVETMTDAEGDVQGISSKQKKMKRGDFVKSLISFPSNV
jgi:hypothetical protein